MVGNRLTENAKRTVAALKRARLCPNCTYVDPAADGDFESLAYWIFCGEHGCSAITRKGVRCRNSATIPEARTCLIHDDGIKPPGDAPAVKARALLRELEEAVEALPLADARSVMNDVSCFEADWWGSNGG